MLAAHGSTLFRLIWKVSYTPSGRRVSRLVGVGAPEEGARRLWFVADANSQGTGKTHSADVRPESTRYQTEEWRAITAAIGDDTFGTPLAVGSSCVRETHAFSRTPGRSDGPNGVPEKYRRQSPRLIALHSSVWLYRVDFRNGHPRLVLPVPGCWRRQRTIAARALQALRHYKAGRNTPAPEGV